MTSTTQIRGRDGEWSQRRVAAGLSITQLATLSGVPRSVVGLIDQGRMVPSPSEATRLLAALAEAERLANEATA